MKATQAATYRTMMQNLQRQGNDLSDLRTTAATGKRLNRPSDDPTAVRPVLAERAQIRTTERHRKTIETGLDRLQAADTQLETVENVMVRAKELAIQAGNGILNAQDRQMLAAEVSELRQQLLGAANAQDLGRHLFAGFRENAPPFAANPAYDPLLDPRPVLYSGDQGVVQLEVGPGERVAVNLSGSALFLGDADGDGATDAGGTDLFATLAGLEQALRANDPAGVQARLGDLDRGADQARTLRGTLGLTGARLESSRERLAAAQTDMEGVLARYEEADILETLSRITQQESAFEAALNVTARISKLSILDYL